MISSRSFRFRLTHALYSISGMNTSRPPLFSINDHLKDRFDSYGRSKTKSHRLSAAFFCLCRHRLIFPGRFQPSIVSTDELNCRVRDGNGWTLIAKDTDCAVFVALRFQWCYYNAVDCFCQAFFQVFLNFFFFFAFFFCRSQRDTNAGSGNA